MGRGLEKRYIIRKLKLYIKIYYGGDYMIPTCRDEISARPAETDLALRLHVEMKFRLGKVGEFSTWHLITFACIFFGFFL